MDFDEILREINEVMEKELSKLAKDAPDDLIREQTLPDGTKTKRLGPFIYACSVTINQDGKTQIREFGNVKPETRSGRTAIGFAEKRESLIDVVETDSELRVVAELPGLEK
jgi:HSP20 family protein